MKIGDAEYLKENRDVVYRTVKSRYFNKQNSRWIIIKPFTEGCKTILSVGCGGVEPIIIHSTHAIDIVDTGLKYLRYQGWKGHFKVASCTNIPVPDKSFDVAVCAEVIEHLPEISDIEKTFSELERVAKKWITSTPANPLGSKNIEPTHKRFLDLETLKKLTSKYPVEVFRDGEYNFVKRS